MNKQTENEHQQHHLQIYIRKHKNSRQESVCQSTHLITHLKRQFLLTNNGVCYQGRQNTEIHHEKFPYSMIVSVCGVA